MRVENRTNTISMDDFIKDYVDVDKFLKRCKECSDYGQIWSCPPYDFDPMDIWRKYKTVKLIGKKIYLEEGDEDRIPEIFATVKQGLIKELLALEKENPGSTSLNAGSCKVCSEGGCSRKNGEPCRFPDRIRYSIESIGGDVCKTAEQLLDTPLLWKKDGKLPEYYMTVGALLTLD